MSKHILIKVYDNYVKKTVAEIRQTDAKSKKEAQQECAFFGFEFVGFGNFQSLKSLAKSKKLSLIS